MWRTYHLMKYALRSRLAALSLALLVDFSLPSSLCSGRFTA